MPVDEQEYDGTGALYLAGVLAGVRECNKPTEKRGMHAMQCRCSADVLVSPPETCSTDVGRVLFCHMVVARTSNNHSSRQSRRLTAGVVLHRPMRAFMHVSPNNTRRRWLATSCSQC